MRWLWDARSRSSSNFLIGALLLVLGLLMLGSGPNIPGLLLLVAGAVIAARALVQRSRENAPRNRQLVE